ncbi:hypothetical protein TNCV_2892381 [Trichonephila clavipes]|nr:hypothetical protein TNCV_2892381 [Trichonephila clavipes]
MVLERPLLALWKLTESDCHLSEERTCQSQPATSEVGGRANSDGGPRNSLRQGTGSTPVVGLEHHSGDGTNYLGEIPRRDDRWRNHLSPPPKFRHGTEGEGHILQSPALVIQPTRLSDSLIKRARIPCALGGIWWHGHRT